MTEKIVARHQAPSPRDAVGTDLAARAIVRIQHEAALG